MVGSHVGRFRIVAALGAGGMASVWLAEDELLGRPVALKLLADELAQSPNARRRFRHEAEIATLLEHPHIVPVYGHGEDHGRAWIAMRHVEGETLAQRITRSLLPVPEALRIAADIVGALGYAHERGVVHRDVTPANVMLAADGGVMVMDFGLAHVESFSRVTSTGVALGTLAYLAPEVLKGHRADARSDLYGAGAILFEMLTGTPPFTGEHSQALAYRVANEDPEPPSRRRAGLPAGLDAFVLRAIAREPAQRWPDAAAWRDALGELRRPPSGPEPARPAAGGLAAAPLAERLLRGEGALYLAIPPFACERGDDARSSLAATLRAALAARLPSIGRVHVIVCEPPGGDETPAAFAERVGANGLLHGSLRVAGSRARVEAWFEDPASGARLAGGQADGWIHQPFELEDALVAAVSAHLRGPARGPAPGDPAAPARDDPAAGEHFAQAQRYLERHDDEASVDAAVALLDRLTRSAAPRAAWFALQARACIAKLRLSNERAWEGRAAAACERALALEPGAHDVRLALADLAAQTGRSAEAEAGYQGVIAGRPGDVEAWLGLARLCNETGRPAQAEAATRRVIELRPADWRGHNMLGRILELQGQHTLAVGAWRRACELSPENARAVYNLGTALYHLDRLDEAIDVFRRSLEIRPTAAAYANLGAAYATLGRNGEAADVLARAAALKPNEPRCWGNLGNVLRFLPGRDSEAHEALTRAVDLMREQLARGPGDAIGWARLADWLQTLGRAAEADDSLRRAMEIGPENAECQMHAAFMYHQRGDREGTLHWLREARRHGYGSEAIRRSAELASLRGDREFEQLLAGPKAKG